MLNIPIIIVQSNNSALFTKGGFLKCDAACCVCVCARVCVRIIKWVTNFFFFFFTFPRSTISPRQDSITPEMS